MYSQCERATHHHRAKQYQAPLPSTLLLKVSPVNSLLYNLSCGNNFKLSENVQVQKKDIFSPLDHLRGQWFYANALISILRSDSPCRVPLGPKALLAMTLL